ncbi:histidine protein kinase NIK1 [Lathyrus oleraceus]|uniref:Response regulatory domain-containing protein n=1 Tax=Pisum sativum TaxID=3888 RepID=A0A9D4XU71_PEA|nr:histidine protein kinase NIK1-like [Pisum sativum]KAI5426199.1 hypothetical protein KIW84_031868 [Pisum sativum]
MKKQMKKRSEVITFTDFDADRQAGPPIVRALVVDNDEHIRKIHVDILKTLGVETCSVETGQEALEIISYDRIYDLILIRRILPVMDGLKVTEMLRNMEYPTTIIGVTHPLTELEKEEFYSAGVDGCIDYEIPLRAKTVETLVANINHPRPWKKRVEYNAVYNTFFRPDSKFRPGQLYHSSSGRGSGSSSGRGSGSSSGRGLGSSSGRGSGSSSGRGSGSSSGRGLGSSSGRGSGSSSGRGLGSSSGRGSGSSSGRGSGSSSCK